LAACRMDRSRKEYRAWRERLRQREREAKGKRWEHVDGGCMLGPKPGGGYAPKGRMPCDDTYEDTRTKREVTFPVMYCQHWEMPFGFDSPREVTRLSGVGEPKYRRAPTPREERCQQAVAKAVGPWKVGREIDMREYRRAYRKCMRKSGRA